MEKLDAGIHIEPNKLLKRRMGSRIKLKGRMNNKNLKNKCRKRRKVIGLALK
uniref:Uncharacterized protein n=1 Tax=Meloidogyne enterolobii TaxID=390850 RepID=A0A6V7VTF3_MELEN|nr:unnamed protein product [Meloidogyne enterolobii]